MIQAITIPCATLQRTAETRFAAPTPMMHPVMVCVVDTGMPSSVAANSMIEPPVSAQQPCIGLSRVIFDPDRARSRMSKEPVTWSQPRPSVEISRPA